MPNLFDVPDAYLGVRIRLEESTWFRHVLQRHPEMAPYLEEVEQALTDPCAVLVSPHYPGRLLYHRAVSGRKAIYVRVVVRIQRNRKGEATRGVALTAFLTNTIGGGEVEWLPRQLE